jgi:hypothetical protein
VLGKVKAKILSTILNKKTINFSNYPYEIKHKIAKIDAKEGRTSSNSNALQYIQSKHLKILAAQQDINSPIR